MQNLEVTINFIHFLAIWKRTLPYSMVVYSFISVLSTHHTLFKERYIKMYCPTKTSLAQSWIFSPGSLWSEEKVGEGGQRKRNMCRTCDLGPEGWSHLVQGWHLLGPALHFKEVPLRQGTPCPHSSTT